MLYRKLVHLFSACLFCGVMISCSQDATKYAPIPQAKQVELSNGKAFVLNEDVDFIFSSASEKLIDAATLSIKKIEKFTGVSQNIIMSDSLTSRSIVFRLNKDIQPEGFNVEVAENNIFIQANDYAGTFYAYQWLYNTLLLQPKGEFAVPCMKVCDYPATKYRGAMLDVSRNFFTVKEVKKFIDLIAMHRLNYFHWHLTDDQGWRIEIKKYPELTHVGAWQKRDGLLKGGYYTQEEIKDVISYAAQRAITVIPEIDLPGHSSAVLAAYPELGCTGGPYQVATEPGGVHRDVLCMGNDKAWQFAKDVLAEVAQLFPAPYIHIGGDEVPRDRWQACKKCQQAIRKFALNDVKEFSAEDLLQGKFNEQMAIYLKSIGKSMIGWDEVLTENIEQETVIMSWRGLGRGTKALKMGHPVIFSSNGHFYFNNYQTAYTEDEPESTGGFLPMSKVFEAEWDTPNLTSEESSKILGVEACLWTSSVPNFDILNVKLLPRLAAFSDVAWGNKDRDYAEFLDRLPDMLSIYKKTGYDYAPHFFDIKAEFETDSQHKVLNVTLKSVDNAEIYYTLDGSKPSPSSMKYTAPISVKESCMLKALAYTKAGLVSDRFEKEINVNKATFSQVHLLTEPAPRYGGNEGLVLVDGVKSPAFCTTGMWVGCNPEPMVVVLDLGENIPMSKVAVSSFTDMSSYIMGIEKMTIEVSDDGKNYKQVAEDEYKAPASNTEKKISDNLELKFGELSARYVKISAFGFDVLPNWHSGAGQKPFLFVDEIEIY